MSINKVAKIISIIAAVLSLLLLVALVSAKPLLRWHYESMGYTAEDIPLTEEARAFIAEYEGLKKYGSPEFALFSLSEDECDKYSSDELRSMYENFVFSHRYKVSAGAAIPLYSNLWKLNYVVEEHIDGLMASGKRAEAEDYYSKIIIGKRRHLSEGNELIRKIMIKESLSKDLDKLTALREEYRFQVKFDPLTQNEMSLLEPFRLIFLESVKVVDQMKVAAEGTMNPYAKLAESYLMDYNHFLNRQSEVAARLREIPVWSYEAIQEINKSGDYKYYTQVAVTEEDRQISPMGSVLLGIEMPNYLEYIDDLHNLDIKIREYNEGNISL